MKGPLDKNQNTTNFTTSIIVDKSKYGINLI